MSPENQQSYQPSKPDLYKVAFPFVARQLNRHYDIEIHGQEHIPDSPSIIIPNHIRFADSALVAYAYTEATGLPLRMAAKSDYFDGEGIDGKGKYGRLIQFGMKYTQMIPVDREGKDPRGFQKLDEAVGYHLEHGDSVGIHAEGTRSNDGKLYKFKSGAARIALKYAVPMVPVGFVYEDFSNGQQTHVDVMFGDPVTPDDYNKLPYSMLPNRQKAEHFIHVVENRVAGLTGMKQAGMFAQLRKLRDQEDKPE